MTDTTTPPSAAPAGERVPLLPCPFCGGQAKLVTHQIAEDAEMAAVECTSCSAATALFEDAYAPIADAAAAWNRRPQRPQRPQRPPAPSAAPEVADERGYEKRVCLGALTNFGDRP